MGWDGLAIGKQGRPLDKTALRHFANAANRVKRKTGQVDGLLDVGALDCSACAKALEELGMPSAWLNYTSEQIKQLANKAKTKCQSYSDCEPWALWSAYEFLQVSAKHNLRYEASY